MKKSNYDLIVGGVIFIALFILIAGVLWLKEVSVARKLVEYSILFPNIGVLQEGDVVTVNGVKRGFVSKISFHESQVAVVIQLDKEIVFTDSSRITVQNIGLMGERQVGIQLSDKGVPCTPNEKGRVHYLRGHFDSGIAEAMGLLGNVLSDVTGLIDTVKNVVYQTVGNEEFVTFFRGVVLRLDTIVHAVDNLIRDNRDDINGMLDNVHAVTADLKTLVAANRSTIDTIIHNGAQLTAAANVIAGRIDSIAVAVHDMVADIRAGKGTVGRLLQDETVIDDLKGSLAALDSLIADINDNGLKLRVKIFGNRRYFKKDP